MDLIPIQGFLFVLTMGAAVMMWLTRKPAWYLAFFVCLGAYMFLALGNLLQAVEAFLKAVNLIK